MSADITVVEADLQLIPMTATEAREHICRITAHFTETYDLILDLYEREGWKSLGYQSWRECVTEEFQQSQSRVYQLLDTAKVERNISNMLEIDRPHLPQRSVDVLKDLPPQAQAEVYQEAVDISPDGKPTAKDVEAVVARKSGSHPTTQSQSNEWYTPKKYVDSARLVMGAIDLDPGSCEEANKTFQADIYHDKGNDGLTKEWAGKVWMNPPYGRTGLAEKFTAKLLEHYDKGEVTEAILCLSINSSCAQWFHPLLDFVICIVDHRILYRPGEGQIANDAPNHGDVFVYLGPDANAFQKEFEQYGTVLVKRHIEKVVKV